MTFYILKCLRGLRNIVTCWASAIQMQYICARFANIVMYASTFVQNIPDSAEITIVDYSNYDMEENDELHGNMQLKM